MTSLGPENGRGKIAENNYADGRSNDPRVEYFFAFKLKDLKAIKNAIVLDQSKSCNGRDVYLFAMNDIQLNAVQFECAKTEDYESTSTSGCNIF